MGEAVRIPWGAWFGDGEKELTFPAEWEARLFPPRDAPEIGDEAIRQAFARP